MSNRAHTFDWWINNSNPDPEDCDACFEANDQCPVHYGVALAFECVGERLTNIGENSELLSLVPASKERRQ